MARVIGRQGRTDAAATRALDSLPHGPYPPEPPRRSLVVNAFMRIAGHHAHSTPHSCGGADVDKVRYEWEAESRHGFWDIIKGHASIEMMDGKDVLDVGCGWGGKAIYYALNTQLRSIVGMDIPVAFNPDVPAEYARSVGATNVSFITGYAESIPLPDASFDLVIMEDVLEHVGDPEMVIKECFRVLRPNGRCVARFPSIRMLYAHHFDRALSLPGLHYLMSNRRWSAGFNHYLVTHPEAHYVPFAQVVDKKFRKDIGMDMSGLTFGSFRSIVEASPFQIEKLVIVGFEPNTMTLRRKLILPVYRALRRLPVLHEVLGFTIVFVGRKPADSQ